MSIIQINKLIITLDSFIKNLIISEINKVISKIINANIG